MKNLSREILIILVLAVVLVIFSRCASFTTPLRDCESACRGDVESFHMTYEGPQCECKDGDNGRE